MELIIVKKPITFGSSYPAIRTGVFLKEEITKYPFDIKNEEYFTEVEYSPISDGTKVMYNGEAYYTKFNINNFSARINRNNIDVEYELCKSMTDTKSKKRHTWESCFEICSFYFFINSEGAICQAFNGQKPKADEWRKNIGNYFATKEDAQKAIITKKCYKVETKINAGSVSNIEMNRWVNEAKMLTDRFPIFAATEDENGMLVEKFTIHGCIKDGEQMILRLVNIK